MKATFAGKLWGLLTLLALIFSAPGITPAPAAAPVFTGNAVADFAALPNTIYVADPTGVDVGVPVQAPPGTISGWDLQGMYVNYDASSDTMYVGFDCYNVCGDADADGNPGGTSAWMGFPSPPGLGGTDWPDLGSTEAMALYLDGDLDYVNGTGSPGMEVAVGVNGTTNLASIGAYDYTNPGATLWAPAFSWGAVLPNAVTAYASPSAGAPDLEFSIANFSTLPGFSFTPGSSFTFRYHAFSGSQSDAGIGEDYMPSSGAVAGVITIPPSYSLGNRVWFDTDNNGALNGAEVGVSGVRVELYQDDGGTPGVYDAGDTYVGFTTTDASGYYRFDDLLAGDYVVKLPAVNFSPGNPLETYWSSGTSIAINGAVSDSIGPDPDDDIDSDDNGVTTFSGNTVDYVSSQTVTLGPGTPEPTNDNDPATNPLAGEAPNDQSNRTVDFGFYRVEVSNQIFVDVDVSGAYDGGDTALSGATVDLYASDGSTLLATTTTGAGGTYLFSGLAGGDYIVKVTPPAGYKSTVDTADGTDTGNPNTNTDNNDNGVGTGAGQVSSNVITLIPGDPGVNNVVSNPTGTTTNPTLDFGFQDACLSAITVTTNADSGAGSLRRAIADVCVGGTITFDGDYTIRLTTDMLMIDKDMTIDGTGHSVIISGDKDGNGAANSGDVRVFGVYNSGVTATLNTLTITNGYNASSGAGIYNQGTLNVTNSTFSNNILQHDATGGGGIYNYGTLTVTNSTFSGNNTDVDGGAIFNGSGTLTVTNSTFSGNSASIGGGIFNAATATLTNVIMANSIGGNCASGGTLNDGGGNLEDDSTCGFSAPTSQSNTNPLLGTLGSYGGGTPTFPLLPGSPAIDATSANCPSTDQRGVARGTTCDIGAFESQGFTLTKSGGDNQSATVNTAFATPLGLMVTANDTSEPVNGGQVTFTPPDASGASAVITGSPATIASDGTVSVTATANGTTGSYNVVASATGAPSVNFSLTNNRPNTTVVSINRDGSTPTNAGSVSWTVTFANAISGLTNSNFTLVNGGLSGTPAITGVTASGGSPATQWTVTASTGVGDGTLGLNLTNDTGLSYSVTNSPFTGQVYTIDRTMPTVTINQDVGQADPTNASPINFTVVFSEPVTGFATGDVTLSGTATGPLTGAVTGGPTTYTVAVSGMTGDGTVIATIPADVAQDAAANGNDASTSSDNTVTYDKTAPTVTVTSLGTQDTTPPLSGTVDDPTATIQVTVNGANYSATNNGDGTWTLADNTITPALAVGVYEVTATATDTAGNVGTDATTNELTIRSKTLVTDVWGGTWQDANQTGDGDDDDFCWAAAAADLLAWGGMGDGDLYNTAQAIFTNFKGHWTDLAGQMAYGWRWWLNGTLPPTRGYTGSKVNVAGAGKYWSTILASNYLYLDSVTSGLLDTISHAFTDGFGVTAGLVQTLTSTVGHALTVWGYESDALLGYTGLYVTDASDGVMALQYVPIRYDTTLNVWTLEGDYAGWYLREIQAFGRRGGLTATTAFGGSGTGTGFLYGQDTSGAVPEPGTLVCVTLGLVGFAALMRRRLRRR